jgi:hypothetical protein
VMQFLEPVRGKGEGAILHPPRTRRVNIFSAPFPLR